MARSSTSNTDLAEQLTEKAAAPAPRDKKALIEELRPEFERAFPNEVDADRFARIAHTTIRFNPKLMKCTDESIVGSLLLCAQLGLEPGGPRQQAFIIPRKNNGVDEAGFQLGYRGVMELARRSGEILSIEAREVCEHDFFEWEYGLNEQLRHRHPDDAERGALRGAYCLARFTNGGHYFVYLSADTIKRHHESRSYEPGRKNSPWQTDRPAMFRKTAVVAAGPFLPISLKATTALANDGTVLAVKAEDRANFDVTELDAPEPAEIIDVDASPADLGGSEETDPSPGDLSGEPGDAVAPEGGG